jgi:ATP-dependent helicase/nuclease subunit B
MAVRFIIGRAGSGKSRRCLDEIRGKLKQGESGPPLILLVPEQATFQAEYALVTTPELGGVIRAQVLSFRRLAYRVMQEIGGAARIHISETGKKMLLHKILHRRKDELRLFSSAANQMGFIDKLNELFSEFKRYRVDSDKLDDHLHNTREIWTQARSFPADKLQDISIIYRDFEHEISRHYIDSEDYLAVLAENMDKSDYITNAEIWIDGFNGFTPQEFNVLAGLMVHAANATFALCLDKPYEAAVKPHELDLFHPTATTMIRLLELAAQLEVAIEPVRRLNENEPADSNSAEADADRRTGGSEALPRFRSSSMLAHLERNYGRVKRTAYASSPDASPNGISIHTAVHRRAEVEGAAREMLKLVREGHCRWRDISVMVRNIEDYHDLLSTIFKDYEIPYFFDRKRSVSHHPLVEFIRSALEVVNQNWRYDAVFRCIKTDFLLPLEEQDNGNLLSEWRHRADELENYVLMFGIHGSRWTDVQPWEFKLRYSLEEESEARTEQDAALLQRIHDTRSIVASPLRAFQRRLKAAGSVKEMTEALYDLLESIGAADRLEAWSMDAVQRGKPEQAREHAGIWSSVMDLFDELVEMMGEQTLAADVYAKILDTGLDSIKHGLVPPSLDQVVVGSMDRTRSGSIKHCFLLGVNEGIMPARVIEGSLLAEAERAAIAESGLELAPGSRRKLLDEQFLIYTTLTVATHGLWLSYPLAGEEGKSLLPSEVIRQVRQLFPQLEPGWLWGEPQAADPSYTQLNYAAHPERALSYLIVQLTQWKRGEAIADIWWEIYNWFCMQPIWRERLQRLTAALFYKNVEAPLSSSVSLQLYGEQMRTSVSGMERFAACPFAHFISYGLRLQERRIYRLEAPDIGQLFHAALSMFAQTVHEDRIEWSALTADECLRRAEFAVDRLSPRLQSEILLSSRRHHYIARKLKSIVGRAAVVLGEHARRGSFVPLALELAFGPDASLPPLVFNLAGGVTMETIGRIDRVDAAELGDTLALRVIDYKSSQTDLRLPELYYGLSLQMLTYLDVVVSHAERWLGRKATPAGALYFHVHNPLLRTNNAVSPEQAESDIFKRFKMKGLVLKDKEAVRLMDHTLDKGSSLLIPVGLKTDGDFTKASSVVSESQWDTLRKYTRKTISDIGTGIAQGAVDIRPYRMGKKTACAHCSYKSICQFDPLIEGNEMRLLPLKSKEEAWKAIEENAGGVNR